MAQRIRSDSGELLRENGGKEGSVKVYKEDGGYRLTVTAVWCYYKVCGQSVAAPGGGGCTFKSIRKKDVKSPWTGEVEVVP